MQGCIQNSYFLFLNACIYAFIHEWVWIKATFWIYLNLCIFIGLLKESMLDCMQGAYTGFWIAKTPNRNYLAVFCWLWGNTFFFISVLSYVKSAILLASIFYATSGYVSLSIFMNFYRLVIEFFLLLNAKQEVFTIMLCILPTVAKTQEPFFDLLKKQMKDDF